MKIVGHRGLPMEYPDNTREGIEAAAAVCDMVEIDIRRTRDGEAVLAHDPQLAGRNIIDMDWQEVSTIDVGDGMHPARLKDVLATVAGFRFNFEIKNSPGDPDFDDTFRFAIEAARFASELDVVTSFHWPTVDAVHKTHPHLTTGLLLDFGDSLEEAVSEAHRAGHEVVAPHWWHLGDHPTQEVTSLVDAGLQVFVWTVNDAGMARKVAAGGAGAVITDDPRRLRKIFETKETR